MKRIVIALVVLVVLILAAAIILPIVFKGKIEAIVKEQVNANLNATVDWGDWDITILKSFPNLTVTIEDVKVCNKAPFEGICLAEIGALSATIDIKSLWRDKIEIKRVGLTRPFIHAKVLADGRANWDIALTDSTAAETPADTSTSAFNVGLQEYWIERGRVIYDDASLPMYMDLRGLHHKGSGDFTQDLFTLSTTTHCDTAGVVFDGVTYLKNATADIKADLDMDLPNMKFTFKENEASVNQLVLGMDGWLAMPGDDIVMDLKWDTRRNDLATILSLVPAEFATDLKGVDMSGKVAFNGFVKGTYNETTMPGFGVHIGVDNGRFKYPDLPESVERIMISCDITSPEGKDLDGMVVDLKRFAMQLAGNPIDARLHLSRPISDPNIDTEVKARLDLASLGRVVPMPKGDELKGRLSADVALKGAMSDIEAQRFEKFKADGELILQDMVYRSDSLPYAIGITNLHFDFNPRYLALVNYTGSIGASDLKASGRIDNYLQWWLKDSTLTGSFTAASELFDLNELMGPSTAETTTEAPADTSQMSLIEVPKNVDFRMNASVRKLVYDNMTLANAKGALHVHDERVDLKDVFFNIFGGDVKMSGSYDTKDKARPFFDLAYDVKELDIEQTVQYVETVQKMAPIAKTCKGKYSTALTMTADLDPHMMPKMETLTGKGSFRTKSMRVDGFQPLVDLAKALKVQGIENTTFNDLFFTYHFKDGKMITDPFDVKIDRIKANVGGSTAFADQAIDYDMKAKVPTDMFGAAANQVVSGWLGQANQAIGSNFQVPAELDLTAKITGTVQKPVIKPVFAGSGANLKETIKEELKQELNVQINKAKEEAIAKAREERDRLIAEAQKQADQLKADARREAARLKGEAYAQADKLVNDAKDPISKTAAKVAAEKLKKEADKKEAQAIAEADKRADGIVETARKKGDDLVRKAEETDTTVK
ncbi:MAG: AsmA family protein [Flavobacteriales bacterium]|nr:AsmA family protein [Flavobacteriales bacterium]